MKPAKRKKLENAGWKIGTADDLLGLTAEESAYIAMKMALSASLRNKRLKKGLSQVALAKLIESSQSRIAKMEAADASVSIDLLVKSLLALGTSPKELATAIATTG